MGTSVRPSGNCLEVGGHLTYRGLVHAPHSATDSPSQESWWTGFIPLLSPTPACHKSTGGWGGGRGQRGGDSKGQRFREEELEERPGREDLQESQWGWGADGGRGGGQAGGWAVRGLERLRPEAAFSTKKGREGGGRERLPS